MAGIEKYIYFSSFLIVARNVYNTYVICALDLLKNDKLSKVEKQLSSKETGKQTNIQIEREEVWNIAKTTIL